MNKKKNRVVIISGPSQVGKDAVVNKLIKYDDLKLMKVVTYTTREPREGEKEGIDHYYISEDEFKEMVSEGLFLEWIPVRNKLFGTPRTEVERLIKQGENPLLKIDVRGAKKVMEQIEGVLSIFIMPDSLDTLKSRMKERGFSEEQMKIRWQETQNELEEAKNYDYRVVNKEGKLDETVKQVKEIIKREIGGK